MSIFFKTIAKTLGFFTAIFFLVVFIGIISKIGKNNNDLYFEFVQGNKDSTEIIAILNISGLIISEPKNTYNLDIFSNIEAIYPSLIKEYLSELKNINIKGLIISINSPGGSVSASQNIFSLIKDFKIKNNIPIYFHSSDILASGGYWISLSGDKIFADYGSLIGSIGVKGPDWLYYNSPTSISTGLLGGSVESPNGIKLFSNSSGKYKDIFNPFREPSKNEKEKLKEMVNDIYIDFVNLVSSNRKIESEIIIDEIGAMIFNTKRAKLNFLIDGEKNIQEVIKEMGEELNLKNIKIINNKKNQVDSFFNLNFIPFNLPMSNNDQKYLIKKKFCNNFYNELSSISNSISRFEC